MLEVVDIMFEIRVLADDDDMSGDVVESRQALSAGYHSLTLCLQFLRLVLDTLVRSLRSLIFLPSQTLYGQATRSAGRCVAAASTPRR